MRALPRPISGRTRPRRRRSCSAAGGWSRIATSCSRSSNATTTSPSWSNGPRRASRWTPSSRPGARCARPGGAGRRDQEDARRRARSQERDPHDPSGRRRHRVAGLGRDAAAHVPALGRAPRLQARDHRLPAGRRGRAEERHGDGHRRIRLRPAVGRGRRASAGAHLAVRSGGAAPYLVRVASTSGPSCPRTSTSRSTTRTCGSTRTDRAAPAASTSTSPTRRSGSRTCRPASSCRARTSDRSTATATRR